MLLWLNYKKNLFKNLILLNMTNYKSKLKNPKWQKKRLEILNLRGFKCELCNNEENELHVHHRFYLKGREPWQYDNDVFQVLCHICHENEHANLKNEVKVEVLPKKYEELILAIKKNGDFDLYNLISLLENYNNDVREMFRLLSNACSSEWIELSLNVIRDKEAIEDFNITLVALQNRIIELESKKQ